MLGLGFAAVAAGLLIAWAHSGAARNRREADGALRLHQAASSRQAGLGGFVGAAVEKIAPESGR